MQEDVVKKPRKWLLIAQVIAFGVLSVLFFERGFHDYRWEFLNSFLYAILTIHSICKVIKILSYYEEFDETEYEKEYKGNLER